MRQTSTGAGTRVNLIDVQTVEGNLYYWADRTLNSVPAAITADGQPAAVSYLPWILVAPSFKRGRSLQTDTGSFTLQNVSGDTLARDFERIVRRSAMEGALFVYRYYNAAAEVADLEFHGKLSVGDVGTSTATLNCSQLFDASADTPAMQYSETCQLVWAEKRCGADPTGVECKYSLPTCQVIERFVGISNTFYDKSYDPAVPVVSITPINRRRKI